MINKKPVKRALNGLLETYLRLAALGLGLYPGARKQKTNRRMHIVS